MFDRTGIREGMVVRSSDGEKLGKVFAVGEDAFHIEKGLFFPKDYVARFSDVSDIRDGEIILAHGRDRLRSADEATFASTSTATTTGAGYGLSGDTTRRADSDREVSVPVAREELDVVKREREAGQVRITKEVVSEEQEVNVPVRKERVRVERRAVDPSRPAVSASSFKDETIVVPLREEEVDVRKRVVSEGDVVIHKDAVEEERRVAETVRREQVDVRTEGDVEDADRSRSGIRAPDDDPLKRY
ncbi:MAG TPA: YsnF/AvaK domain-containing protein [Aggregicoccus sp.]|nr:YsnF/AvaK domain-containing protein [Aggregicoccus sp.]